jgi:hypothetical protein
VSQMLRSPEVFAAQNMVRSANFGVKHLSSVQMPSKAGQGFFYPGPRQLKDIVKLPLLNAHGASRVREIWTEFHKDHKSAIADILTADEFGTLMQRSQRCPFFVLPVPRYVGSTRYTSSYPGSVKLNLKMPDTNEGVCKCNLGMEGTSQYWFSFRASTV